MQYKAVIFDLDDTLCNTAESKNSVFEKIYQDNSKFQKVDLNHFKRLLNSERNRYLARVGGMQTYARIEMWLGLINNLNISLSVKELKKVIDDYWKYTIEFLELFPQAKETLEYLIDKKVTTVMLAGGDFYTKATKLTTLGIDNHFKFVFTSDLVRQPKNDPAIYRFVLNYIGTEAPAAIMVGNDPEQDIIPAKQVGIKTIKVGNPLKSAHKDFTPDISIASIAEFVSVFEELSAV